MRGWSAGLRRKTKMAPVAACALLLASAAQAQPGPRTDNPRRTALDRAVDAQAQRFFANACHVGLSIAVVSGDERRFYNYGSTTRGRERLPSSTSLYEIASVTKTFTGALAAQALIDGRMDLDADFRHYLDGPFPNLSRGGRAVTLRDLATHTSGLPRDIPDSDALLDKPDYKTLPTRFRALQRGYSPSRYLAALRQTRLRSDPGRTEAYSNTGMMVIAFGLEQVYDQPFPALLQQKILQPLGMTSTGFSVSGGLHGRLVQGYDRLGAPAPALPAAEYAAWGLYSDAQDMARYVAWHLDVAKPVIARAHAPIDRGGADEERKALIWNIGADGGAPLLWHGGGSFGATSQLVLYPAGGEGYALLANDACAGTEGDLKAMAQAVHHAR